ncbi:MAG: RidA family protein [Alcaligenes sp.]|nr:RidA family protein [Alcaligenes sp.]
MNPASLYNSTQFGFSHAVVQDNSRTVHLAGQVAWDGQGQLVGKGDRIAQTRQALQNLKTVLKEAGASAHDVVRLRTYLVGHTPEELGPICALINEFYEGAEPAANTLLGVANLALPDMLVEIEATARLP